MVTGEDLVVSGVVAFEDGEGEAGKAVHVYLIWGQPGGGVDGIVVSTFQVRQIDALSILYFVDDHREHLSQGVIDALNTTAAVGMIGAHRAFLRA